ncbi:MAG: DNA repair protein RadC, partial [Nanoarchaeota archaeon]
LSRKRINELKNLNGIGMAKACQIVACFELGRRLAGFNEEQKPTLSNAKDVVDIFMPEMSTQKKEYFIGAFLDTRKRLINSETIFVGSLNASIVHPREIFRSAIEEGAAAIILLHNHPSGNPEPSKEDILTTKQLIKAGNLIGIEVLDHIIIGNKDYFSFKENDYF